MTDTEIKEKYPAMNEIYNIYCDESCHLENDGIKPMALGAVWVKKEKVKEIHREIRNIKERHNFRKGELKWTKISLNHYNLYLDIINYFFDTPEIHFRGVLIPDKELLNYDGTKQCHDDWYYKMFFVLLKMIFNPNDKYNIYLDYKDTKGSVRLRKLHDVLRNNYYDFRREIIQKSQLVHSHEVELIQLADIITGALTYNARRRKTNAGKVKIVDTIKRRSGYSLDHNTLYREEKFNLLIWKPQKGWEE